MTHMIAAPVITGLYVPGDRPERFDKAVATGAQLVILDLEDAVADAHKASAREAVASWLRARAPGDTVVQVRINAGEPLDLAALAAVDAEFEIRVPKVESLSDLDVVARAVPREELLHVRRARDGQGPVGPEAGRRTLDERLVDRG